MQKKKISILKISLVFRSCLAQLKIESARDEMNASGYQDVDYVLTTREFLGCVKPKSIGITFRRRTIPIRISTGAGDLGTTGGVMELL